MSPQVKDTVIKLTVVSFVVGLFLGFFDIDPRQFLSDFGETVLQIFSVVASVVEWAVKSLLLGAVIVVPVWLVFFVIGQLRRRKSKAQ